MLVDLDMARAVHRLDCELAAILRRGGEHVLAEGLPVAGSLPQALVEDLRRVHLAIADGALATAHVVLESLEKRPALRVPEHDAGPLLLEVEEIHLAPEPAMVPLLGFLKLLEVSLKILLGSPGGAIDAL